MANTATRLSANGSLTINGTFDEVTYNPTANVIVNILNFTDLQPSQINSTGASNTSTGFVAYCGGYSSLTNNSTDFAAPDGSFTAFKITNGTIFACGVGPAWGILQNKTNVFRANTTYTASIWARTNSSTPVAANFGLNENYSIGVTLTTQWQ